MTSTSHSELRLAGIEDNNAHSYIIGGVGDEDTTWSQVCSEVVIVSGLSLISRTIGRNNLAAEKTSQGLTCACRASVIEC